MSPVIACVKPPTVRVIASAPPSPPMYLTDRTASKPVRSNSCGTSGWSKPPDAKPPEKVPLPGPAATATAGSVNRLKETVGRDHDHARTGCDRAHEADLVGVAPPKAFCARRVTVA